MPWITFVSFVPALVCVERIFCYFWTLPRGVGHILSRRSLGFERLGLFRLQLHCLMLLHTLGPGFGVFVRWSSSKDRRRIFNRLHFRQFGQLLWTLLILLWKGRQVLLLNILHCACEWRSGLVLRKDASMLLNWRSFAELLRDSVFLFVVAFVHPACVHVLWHISVNHLDFLGVHYEFLLE